METLGMIIMIVKRTNATMWPSNALTLQNNFGSGAEFVYYDSAKYETVPTSAYVTVFTYTLGANTTGILSFQVGSGVSITNYNPTTRTFTVNVTNFTNPTLKLICCVRQSVTTRNAYIYKDDGSGGNFGYVYPVIQGGSTFVYDLVAVQHTLSFYLAYTITDYTGVYEEGWMGADVYVNGTNVWSTNNTAGNVVTLTIPAINPSNPSLPTVEIRAKNGGWTWQGGGGEEPPEEPPVNGPYWDIVTTATLNKVDRNGNYAGGQWSSGTAIWCDERIVLNGRYFYKQVGAEWFADSNYVVVTRGPYYL